MAFIGLNTFGDLPVREARVEGGGNVLIHRLECLEDKGVIRGCSGDVMGESGIMIWTNIEGGSSITPSLSSSGGSRLGHLERASGATRSLPGTWTILRSKSARSKSQQACLQFSDWALQKYVRFL